MIRSMFKTRKPKRFDYHSLYYSAAKEDLEQRVKMATSGNSISEESIRRKLSFGDKFSESNTEKQFYSKLRHQKSMSRIRFLIILQVLVVIVFIALLKLF